MTIASLITIIFGNNRQKPESKPDPEIVTCLRCWSAVPRTDWDAHAKWCDTQPFPAYLYHLIHL